MWGDGAKEGNALACTAARRRSLTMEWTLAQELTSKSFSVLPSGSSPSKSATRK